jgi:hypothetical protein
MLGPTHRKFRAGIVRWRLGIGSPRSLDQAAQAKDEDAALEAHGKLETTCMASHRAHRVMGGPGMKGMGKGLGGPPGFGPPGGGGPRGSGPQGEPERKGERAQ